MKSREHIPQARQRPRCTLLPIGQPAGLGGKGLTRGSEPRDRATKPEQRPVVDWKPMREVPASDLGGGGGAHPNWKPHSVKGNQNGEWNTHTERKG